MFSCVLYFALKLYYILESLFHLFFVEKKMKHETIKKIDLL